MEAESDGMRKMYKDRNDLRCVFVQLLKVGTRPAVMLFRKI